MIKRISAKEFRTYGWVIAYPKKSARPKFKNLFRVVLRERSSAGWRIAYLVVRDKSLNRLEQHVESFESFEPVKGKSLLYVASRKDPRAISCFYLDKPIILKKGLWHGVVTLTPEAEIKITENAKVKCIYWKLGFTLPLKGIPSVKPSL